MKEKILYTIVLGLLFALLSACGAKPDEIVLQLAEATNAKNIEDALALFSDDAVVTSVSPAPFTGKAEIRGWLEGMFADNFQIEVEIVEVNENIVIEKDTMSMDSMSFYGVETLTGTSEMSIQEGLIQSLEFQFSEETLADLQSAPFVAPEELIGTWSVGTYIKFFDDNSLRVATKLDDLDMPVSEEHPGSLERWSYDGMVITMEIVEFVLPDATCSPGQIGYYYVRWAGTDMDRLKFEPIEDACGTRYGGMQWGNWVSVSP